MKNLQEQIKRMKSLMGEERLWGNLVDEKILTENRLLRNIVTAARNAKNIPVQTITRRAREALKYALKNSDVLARKASFNSMIGRIGGDVWESELREILVKVKIRSEVGRRVLSEGEIQSVLRDIAAKDKVILVALRDGKSGDDIVDALNSAQKEITFTKESVQDMVYMLYGNDVFILNKLGVRMKLRVIPDNELVNNTDDVLRTMGYTDEEIKAAREASKTKVKPKLKGDKSPTKKGQEQKKSSADADGRYLKASPFWDKFLGKKYFTPEGNSKMDWKNGWLWRATETAFWKIRLAPKMTAFIGKHTSKFFNRISPFVKIKGIGIGDAIVKAFKYSPILMETWALINLWIDKVEFYNKDGELDINWVGDERQTNTGEWTEVDDDVLNIIWEHFTTFVSNNPVSYIGYVSGFGLTKAIWGESVANQRKKMSLWVDAEFLCCPETPAYDDAGTPLTNGWPAPGCKMYGQPGYHCQFPDGPPSCEELYEKVFVTKMPNGKTPAEEKFEQDVLENFGEEQGWTKKTLKALGRIFKRKLGLEDDWAEMEVKDIMPDAQTLCNSIAVRIDMDKIKEEVKETMEEVKKQTDEEIADYDYKKINVIEAQACEMVEKIISVGDLVCEN